MKKALLMFALVFVIVALVFAVPVTAEDQGRPDPTGQGRYMQYGHEVSFQGARVLSQLPPGATCAPAGELVGVWVWNSTRKDRAILSQLSDKAYVAPAPDGTIWLCGCAGGYNEQFLYNPPPSPTPAPTPETPKAEDTSPNGTATATATAAVTNNYYGAAAQEPAYIPMVGFGVGIGVGVDLYPSRYYPAPNNGGDYHDIRIINKNTNVNTNHGNSHRGHRQPPAGILPGADTGDEGPGDGTGTGAVTGPEGPRNNGNPGLQRLGPPQQQRAQQQQGRAQQYSRPPQQQGRAQQYKGPATSSAARPNYNKSTSGVRQPSTRPVAPRRSSGGNRSSGGRGRK
jgi:hypothetical protein